MPNPATNSGIRDNHKRGVVADFLKAKIHSGSRLSVVSAYFTIYAYDALREHLDQIDHLDFLFGEPRFIASLDPDKTEKKAFILDANGLQLANRLEQKRVARDCAEWMRQKVDIRSIRHAQRLLVLDDVLIGLDLSNRIPVLRLLEEEFKDWQVLLLTYDRVWFDLAQEYTEQTKRWTYLKLLELSTTPGSYSMPLIEPHSSLTQIAEKHWNANDYMAAAVYVRAAFETRIRNVCRDHGVEIAYKPDPKDMTTNKLWEGIVARQTKRQTDGKPDFIAPALMQDVETVRSTILNRLSHSCSPALVKNEVKFALDTMKTLEHHQFTKIKIVEGAATKH